MKMAARLGWSIGSEKVLSKVGSKILWGTIKRRFPMQALQVHRVAAVIRRHARPGNHREVNPVGTILSELTGIYRQIKTVVPNGVVPGEYSADSRRKCLNITW